MSSKQERKPSYLWSNTEIACCLQGFWRKLTVTVWEDWDQWCGKKLGSVKIIHLLMRTDHQNTPCFGIDPLYLTIPVDNQKGQTTVTKS